MGSDLIRVEYHRQAQVAIVAGSNLLDMLRRTAKWSETLNVHYHVPAHSLYWL